MGESFGNNNLDCQGNPLNIQAQSDDQAIMNTPFMMDLRLEMLKGKWPDMCIRCRQTEKAGGISRRQRENRVQKNNLPKFINRTNNQGHILAEIHSIDFRMGNICNLACRMCNPRSSSKWTKDWQKIDQDWFACTDEILEEYRSYNWHQDPKVWANFQKQLPHLEHINFAGGEPLIIPEMIKALEVCIDSGYSKNIALSYNTNLTILPQQVKKLWPHFKSTHLLVSLDAYGSLNDYIRYPSKWQNIEANLFDLEENFEKYGLGGVLISVTVQAYNILRLPELYQFLRNNFKKISIAPQLINLFEAEHYRTQILPEPLKQQAAKNLLREGDLTRKALEGTPNRENGLRDLNWINDAIQFMNSEDQQYRLKDFFRAAHSKDRFRSENLFQVLPEFKPLYQSLNEQNSKVALLPST